MRIGIGYDIHKLAKERKLILGGIRIPFDYGLVGHSDADVLLHAIMDAMLGAAGLKDIGHYFPADDPKYKNVSSLKLLKNVNKLVSKKGYCLGNIDTTLIAEAPKMATFTEEMRSLIGSTLNIATDQVMIKATTNEGLGAIGKKKAIAALAVVMLLEKNRENGKYF